LENRTKKLRNRKQERIGTFHIRNQTVKQYDLCKENRKNGEEEITKNSRMFPRTEEPKFPDYKDTVVENRPSRRHIKFHNAEKNVRLLQKSKIFSNVTF
jgi:hypothetical protein